ncbi:Mov34/MPN/PAD-1 family protein [Dactylosporangium sp. CA-233914]|uniref:Mov34/MPN/PAD-1 family protein n=1 Tax=Dactylosporangium sp. CA-233914 TaxID=3239934 RepID=UPI003D8D782C
MLDDLDFPIEAQRRDLPQHRPADLALLAEQDSPFRLYLHDDALNGMKRHAALDPRNEVGGVLIGRHYQRGDQLAVVVREHLPVPSRSRGAAHFEFDELSTRAILERLDSIPGHVDEYVVGWYHSHVSGRPFMSVHDNILHRDHFGQPWHVSCVIGVEPWARPAGFWRLVDGELEEINGYVVDMAYKLGDLDRHTDYLDAAGLSEDDPWGPALDLPALLRSLGVPPGGRLLGAIPEDRPMPADGGLDTVRFLVQAAQAAAKDPAAVDELSSLSDRLRLARSFDRAMSRRLVGGWIQRRIQVHGHICYAYLPGSSHVIRTRTSDAQIWTLTFTPAPRLLAHSEDGALWALTAQNQIVRFSTEGDGESDEDVELNAVQHVVLHGITGEVRQFMVRPDALWLLTDASWYQVPLTRMDKTVTFGPVVAGVLPAQDCALLDDRGPKAATAAALVGRDGDRLQLWQYRGSGWNCAVEQRLPTPWNEWRPTHAARCGSSVFVLFDDGDLGQLGRFDLHSLDLELHLVRNRGMESSSPITGFCGDGLGRVYAFAEGVLYRV